MVKARGGGVALECREPLLRLFAGFPGVDQLVPEGAPLPKFDVHVPLMSLPFIFKTNLQSVPANVPYLSADPGLAVKWKENLGTAAELRIVIAWQGNPHHKWDRYRFFRRSTSRWLNATLAFVHLGVLCPKTSQVGILVADQSYDPAKGRFQIRIRTQHDRQLTTIFLH